MPVDRYRITGPEETQNPRLFQKFEDSGSNLFDEGGKRKDGRGPSDVRPVFMKAGAVSQAQGSAYVEIGSTKVICGVYGPRQVLRREDFSMTGILRCHFKYATFSCPARRQFQVDTEEHEFALIVEHALAPAVCLHKFPKSQVDVNIRVLENDGSALAAAIMSASVALADAAIEMYDVVTACSMRISKEEMLLDPTYDEQTTSVGSESPAEVTVGLLPSINQTSALHQQGNVTCDMALKAIQACTEGAQQMYPLIHECIRNSVKGKHQSKTKNGDDPGEETKDNVAR